MSIDSGIKHTPSKNTLMDTVGTERTLYREDGLVVSPCKKRPDNGEPCFMLDKPKTNLVCEDCKFLGGRTYKTNRELRLEWKEESAKKEKCIFPGCNKKVMNKEKYCADCLSRIISRSKAWKRDNGDVAIPIEWLHRATMTNKEKSERKKNGMLWTAI